MMTVKKDIPATKLKKIDLSTIIFYKDSLPATLELAECGLDLLKDKGMLTALFGHRAKQEGFMAAKLYADEHNLKFTVIDLLVEVKDTVKSRNNLKLDDNDVINLNWLTKPLAEKIYKTATNKQIMDLVDLNNAFLEKPSLIKKLANNDEFKDTKLFIYPAKLDFYNKPLLVASIPYKHWKCILESNCRLDPLVNMKLTHPKNILKDTSTEKEKSKAIKNKAR